MVTAISRVDEQSMPRGGALREDSNEELVKRCQRGEWKCFETLVERYEEAVCHRFRRNRATREQADDLTQETFVRAYANIQKCDPRRFPSWIFRIARNLATDAARSNKRRRRGDSKLRAIEEAREREEERKNEQQRDRELDWLKGDVAQVLKQLPEEERRFIRWRFFDKLDIPEIARRSSMTPGSVRNKLSQIMKKIRRFWDREMGGGRLI